MPSSPSHPANEQMASLLSQLNYVRNLAYLITREIEVIRPDIWEGYDSLLTEAATSLANSAKRLERKS